MLDQRHRPRYHFLPPANWMNDPNGLIQWQGVYHLFYQHNPHGAFWGTMHWGHAASRDLVHWEHWPIALAPTPGGPDADGCFSGCAVDDGGVPTLVYTGVSPEVQCLATSRDGLRTWQKHPANPVIAAPPPGLSVTGFRDPCVWREGNDWLMALGSGLEGMGGAVLLYRSADLRHWDYLGPLCTGREEETGAVWECPNFFALGGRHALITSPIPLRRAIYFTGRYAEHRFTPAVQGTVDWGGCYYAPQILREAGRTLLFGWLWEGRSPDAQQAAGWAGVMSLPRALSLTADGQLAFAPALELQALRREPRHFAALDLAPGAETMLPGVSGDSLEIALELDPGEALTCGLRLLCTPDGSEEAGIVYDRAGGQLLIDRARSSLSDGVEREARGGPLALTPGEALRLRVFVDRSVVEVFANETLCITSRVYPTQADAMGVRLFAQGGGAKAWSLDVWQMAPIH